MEKVSMEEKILKAAAKVFTEKGYAATKTRDIAEAAGIKNNNVASIHYYYRSKEKLFAIIAGEALRKMSHQMDSILNSQEDLHLKIQKFVPAYIDFIKENPFLPMFIFSESQKNADKLSRQMGSDQTLAVLEGQLTKLSAEGKIRPITPQNFMSNIIGLIVFPFMGKEILKVKTGMNDEDFLQMLEERKTMIVDMIINHLYLEMPE